MRYVTVDQVMRWRPCYCRNEVKRLFAGRERVCAAEIAAMRNVPVSDRLWALSHMLSPVQRKRAVAKRPDAFFSSDPWFPHCSGVWYWYHTIKGLVALRLAVAELGD